MICISFILKLAGLFFAVHPIHTESKLNCEIHIHFLKNFLLQVFLVLWDGRSFLDVPSFLFHFFPIMGKINIKYLIQTYELCELRIAKLFKSSRCLFKTVATVLYNHSVLFQT